MHAGVYVFLHACRYVHAAGQPEVPLPGPGYILTGRRQRPVQQQQPSAIGARRSANTILHSCCPGGGGGRQECNEKACVRSDACSGNRKRLEAAHLPGRSYLCMGEWIEGACDGKREKLGRSTSPRECVCIQKGTNKLGLMLVKCSQTRLTDTCAAL